MPNIQHFLLKLHAYCMWNKLSAVLLIGMHFGAVKAPYLETDDR